MSRLLTRALASVLVVAGLSVPSGVARGGRSSPALVTPKVELLSTVSQQGPGDNPDLLGAGADARAAFLAELEAQAVAAYLEAVRPRIMVDWARWERLHVCEQSDTWYANGGNAADPARQVFQGGLGMSTAAWQLAVRAAATRGVTLPSSALAGSPEEQMTGAQAFYDAYGWGWECRV